MGNNVALPEGFQLDAPALPEGFVLDQTQSLAPQKSSFGWPQAYGGEIAPSTDPGFPMSVGGPMAPGINERSQKLVGALPVIGATAASLAAPEIALPAWAARLYGARTAIMAAPKIAAAFGGGAAGGGAKEAILNKEATPQSIGKAGIQSGIDMAEAELLGSYAGFFLKKALSASPKAITAEGKKAIDWAKSKKAPIALSDVENSFVSSLPGKSLAGEFAEGSAAKKANQIINNEILNMSQGATTIDNAAMKGNDFFRTVLSGAEGSMKKAFGIFEQSVGKDAIVPLTSTAPQISKAITSLERIGQGGGLLKKLKLIQESGLDSRTLNELELIRKEVGKSVGKNYKLKEIVDDLSNAIIKDYEVVGKRSGVDLPALLNVAKGETKKFKELAKIPGLERFAKEIGDRGAPAGTRNWISELFTEKNKMALAEMQKQAPEIYQELASTNMAQIISKNMKPHGFFGNTLDGKAFREYVVKNSNNLKNIYGDEIYDALDNFSSYAKYTTEMVDRAGKTLSGSTPGQVVFGWGMKGAELGAAYKFPYIVIPAEGAAYGLAKSLTNPNGKIFNAFSKGFDLSGVPREATKFTVRSAFESSRQPPTQEQSP